MTRTHMTRAHTRTRSHTDTRRHAVSCSDSCVLHAAAYALSRHTLTLLLLSSTSRMLTRYWHAAAGAPLSMPQLRARYAVRFQLRALCPLFALYSACVRVRACVSPQCSTVTSACDCVCRRVSCVCRSRAQGRKGVRSLRKCLA